MCAIAGYVGRGTPQILNLMLQKMAHRGPDDTGVFVDGNVGLGSNRLAIIDLSSKAHQPMFDNEKSICIVFNGEIYNYQVLRRKLETKYQFKSRSDTEVLLYAYKEWGAECLKKINGMFCFVVYDRRNNLLFGARDRLGEKPLKYYLDGDVFAFASEIKGLFPILKNKPEMDPIAINHYLTLQYIPTPYTGLKKIFKLPAAHYFLYKNGKIRIKKYWDIEFGKKLDLAEEDWEEIVFKKLKESVKSRMIADVPVGVLLSGGVDSSAILALASEFSSKKIKTFSIGFDDPKFDESKYASLVAGLYQTDHKAFQADNKTIMEVFEHLADYYDEPFADNSAIPTLILAKLTGKYVKVALSGDGGDENFAGYERYNIVALSDFYNKLPVVLRKTISYSTNLTNMLIHTKFTRRLNTYAKTFENPFYRRYLYYSCFFDNESKYKLYTPGFHGNTIKHDTFDIFKNLYSHNLSDLDNALNFDIHTYLPEDLLFKTDIASMTYSLEIRAPFLNHELIELTAQIPSNLKIKFFNTKYLFKKVLKQKQLVPDEILRRPKKGFITPIDKWLKKNCKGFAMDLVRSKKFMNLEIFDTRKLEKYLTSYFQSPGGDSNSMFAILSLTSWTNKYL